MLVRLGRWDAAAELLVDVKEDMDLNEVGDYYETLLMYKGHTSPGQLLKKARGEGFRSVQGDSWDRYLDSGCLPDG